jgi:hypothetical protein
MAAGLINGFPHVDFSVIAPQTPKQSAQFCRRSLLLHVEYWTQWSTLTFMIN